MARETKQQQDSWTEGMSHIREAVEHNLTASRLLTTGAIAIGAAATAYFWDPNRRSAFFESTRKLSEDMTSWWSSQGSRPEQSGASTGDR